MSGQAIDTSRGAEQAAIDVLMDTVVHDGMISLPVDVEFIAHKLGLVVQRMRLSNGTDGLLVKDIPYEPFKAVVDADASARRSRFTLAHEIGHYVKLYQDWPDGDVTGVAERRDALSSKGLDEGEIWANDFAAALLMPARLVIRMWGDGCSVETMADLFNVSETAMSIRISNLGLE